MQKATEAASTSDGKVSVQKFDQIVKADLKQDDIHDFLSYTSDGNCVALLGSKTELITMELSPNAISYHAHFPYYVTTYKCSNDHRPLDVLSKKVDLHEIYSKSNVLEMQQLSLEPAYTAPCSQEVPSPKILAARWSPQPMPTGEMLLATLNSFGSLEFLIKSRELQMWLPYELGLNVAATLRDMLQPPFEVPACKIDTFRRYQAFIDRCWITMFTWRPLNSDNLMLVLGTAAGSLWTLTLSSDTKTVLAHSELQTLLDRICYLNVFEDLLLVGDNSGLVHLYRFTEAEEEGLELVKTLWLRPDHMALQQALITSCPERKCYYIACCKAAHLLVWCMPRKFTADWPEIHLHIGGIKITGLCALGKSTYAVSTARGQLYRIDISQTVVQKSPKLTANKQPIGFEDNENFLPIGLVSSPHKNLFTILEARDNEYLMNRTNLRDKVQVRVGRLQKIDALCQLADYISEKIPINKYEDLLVDLRLDIFNLAEVESYTEYAPLKMFSFDALATESQLHQLQLKYHVLNNIMDVQRGQPKSVLVMEPMDIEMQLLLTMLTLTHMRLRLQYLCGLAQLTPFQRKASVAMLMESARIRQQADQELPEKHYLNGTAIHFLVDIAEHFDKLQRKLQFPELPKPDDNAEQVLARCCISHVELTPSLSRHYCTLCERQILLESELLQELYAPNDAMLCPYCHGAYKFDIFDA